MPLVIARVPSGRARWRRRTMAAATMVTFTVQVADDAGATDEVELTIAVKE